MQSPSDKGSTQLPLNALSGQNDADSDSTSVVDVAQRVWEVLRRYKFVVLAVIVAGMVAGYAWLDRQVPIYRATTTVMIDLAPPKILSNVNEVVEMAGQFSSDVQVQIAAAEALEASGEMEAARGILLEAATSNSDDFSLLRALRFRRLPVPELARPEAPPEEELSAPGHGEGLP